MMNRQNCGQTRLFALVALSTLIVIAPGCRTVQLPAIDPTGSRIFLPHPYATTPLLPGPLLPGHAMQAPPVRPAFTHPVAKSCATKAASPVSGPPTGIAGHLSSLRKKPGQEGEIILTPSKIIAPVNSEVIVMAGICGGDGYYVINQPLEWMVTPDSVGDIIEVGGTEHPEFNKLVPPSSKKFDGQYAWGRTALKEKLLTRGTPTPVDDVPVEKGQHYITLSSPSEGTSYVTCVAPKAKAWDRRRATTKIYWVDAVWSIPAPTRATAGEPFTLNTLITRATDGLGVKGYKVKYSIVGGAPAEFLPTGAQSAVITTTDQGTAPVQIRQHDTQATAGTTQIQVDIIRPGTNNAQDIVLESGLTSIAWSAPALTIRAIGPRTAGLNQPFNYRLEITNPGDQIARNVIVRTKSLDAKVQYISSDPKPAQYGDQYQWNLGDVQPSAPTQIIEVQLKSSELGAHEVCFEVSSDTDQLRTEACATTTISLPCIGVELEGPTTAQVGGVATFNVTVSNQCSEPLTNVQLRIQADEGLRISTLGSQVVRELGTLAASQRITSTVQFDVLSPGKRCFSLDVVADGGHTAAGRRCFDASQVIEPGLKVSAEAEPAVATVGQPVLARITVSNTGNVPISNISVLNKFSPSLKVSRATSANDNLEFRFIGKDFAFLIVRLEPNAQQVLEIEFIGQQPDGDAFDQAVVTTAIGANSTQTARFRIEAAPAGGERIGIPQAATNSGALAVEVATIANPIRRGQESTAFEIRVSNKSNADLQNVDISLLVPPDLRLTSINAAEGAIPIRSRTPDGTQVALETQATLRAGESIRFTANVVGNLIGQPVLEVVARAASGATARDSKAVQVTQ